MFKVFLAAGAAGGMAVVLGCTAPTSSPRATAPATLATATHADAPDAEVRAERDRLAPADRALVEAQEWCAVSTDERLGAMGPPLKLDIKGQPVFVCCKGCKKKAEADPDKTLATVDALKSKAKAARAGGK